MKHADVTSQVVIDPQLVQYSTMWFYLQQKHILCVCERVKSDYVPLLPPWLSDSLTACYFYPTTSECKLATAHRTPSRR